MKSLAKLGMFFSLLITFTAQSQAALLLEPIVGYSVGSFNIESPVGDDSESLRGTSYGGRVGYQNLGFQLGVDYLASNLDVDGDDLKTSEWAGFIGFEFPILVRVYGAYIFSGNGDYDVGTGLDLKGANGPKIGVGFTLLPFLDINVDYRRITYDTLNSTDFDYSATMVSVSLPFTI